MLIIKCNYAIILLKCKYGVAFRQLNVPNNGFKVWYFILKCWNDDPHIYSGKYLQLSFQRKHFLKVCIMYSPLDIIHDSLNIQLFYCWNILIFEYYVVIKYSRGVLIYDEVLWDLLDLVTPTVSVHLTIKKSESLFPN